jgi:hypothetical protein
MRTAKIWTTEVVCFVFSFFFSMGFLQYSTHLAHSVVCHFVLLSPPHFAVFVAYRR